MSVLVLFNATETPTQQAGTWATSPYIIASVSGKPHGNIQFLDETGLNPLPVGVFVQIYPALGPRNNTTLVGSGYTSVGGYVDIQLQPGSNYVAVFSGRQAPVVAAYFGS